VRLRAYTSVVKTCPCGERNTDRARFCQACGRPLPVPARVPEVRKTVTVVFADVTGFTPLGERLDPETLRRVMTRYFQEMAATLERHGGTVEKFIGDAVMAVFGVPVVHEDDALRAVRAATEMRSTLLSLNDELQRTYGVTLEARIGINTGEVVAGDVTGGQTLVTGDAVNVAARLEEASPPGQILIGESTYRLVRDAVTAEPTDLAQLRGKGERVATYRLLDVRDVDVRVARRLHAPIVGRVGELSLLRQAFELSEEEEGCYLFTVLGNAGVGKSRLTDEALARLSDRPAVLRGRCLPYGEGITYWPVREIVWQACGIAPDSDARDARASIVEHLGGEEHSERIAEGVAHIIGLSGASGTPEEMFWGARRFLEVTARERPVVVVFDDIHWAEPSLLDLIEYLADFTRRAVLILCMARLDLLEVRPAWGAGRQKAMTITLPPLSEADSGVLVQNLLGGAGVEERARAHIAEMSEGNPLFIEEIVRMLLDRETLRMEDGRWIATHNLAELQVPPTISALLGARLERLDEGERAVAQRASVVGKSFYWGAVAALTPEEEREDVGRQLQSLTRKELITPDESPFSGEDAFRFRHMLIRDAAYQAIPKETRGDLHERLAVWIEERVRDRIDEFEEIIGHHLEQAHLLRLELGRRDDRTRELGKRAAERLAAAGRRALGRGDAHAAGRLLPRAAGLLPENHPDRASILADVGQALIARGSLAEAGATLAKAEALSARGGDPGTEARAALLGLWVLLHTEPEGKTERIRSEVERLIPVLEGMGDQRALAQAHGLLVEVDWMACRYSAAEKGLERAADHARRAGDRQLERDALHRLVIAILLGTSPPEEGIARCREILARAEGDRRVEAAVLFSEAILMAMLGRFEGTRERIARARAILDDLGSVLPAISSLQWLGFVEMLAGDLEAAQAAFAEAYRSLERLGERGFLSTIAAQLARVLSEQGRFDEAERHAHISLDTGATDDISSQVDARAGLALAVAGRDRAFVEAERLARQAVELAEATDDLFMQGDAWSVLGNVLGLASRPEQAAEAFDRAIERYGRKGVVVSARRALAARERVIASASRS
jgi:class 3 adenylate cyclase/tetratricopeptide (TPR) repeat protein